MGPMDLNKLIGPVSKDNLEAQVYRSLTINPPKDGIARIGGAAIPLDHEYAFYDVNGDPMPGAKTGPRGYRPVTGINVLVQAIQSATAAAKYGQTWDHQPTMIFDKTTGQGLDVATPDGKYTINPAYLNSTPAYATSKAAAQKELQAAADQQAAAKAEQARMNAYYQSMPQL